MAADINNSNPGHKYAIQFCMKLIKGSKETSEMLHECYRPEVRVGLKFSDNGSVFKNGHSKATTDVFTKKSNEMLMQARKCFGNCLPVRMYQ
jgi:hypothetical protein